MHCTFISNKDEEIFPYAFRNPHSFANEVIFIHIGELSVIEGKSDGFIYADDRDDFRDKLSHEFYSIRIYYE